MGEGERAAGPEWLRGAVKSKSSSHKRSIPAPYDRGWRLEANPCHRSVDFHLLEGLTLYRSIHQNPSASPRARYSHKW
jgi:hypothetical protein